MVLAGQSVDPYNDKTVRATVGSLWHLPLALHDDPADAVRRAQTAGFTVLAADGAGETDLFEAAETGLLDGPVAWLFGNEAWGLPDDLAALGDHRVAIPILGRAESLNLATAAASACTPAPGVAHAEPREANHASPRRREAWASHASWTSRPAPRRVDLAQPARTQQHRRMAVEVRRREVRRRRVLHQRLFVGLVGHPEDDDVVVLLAVSGSRVGPRGPEEHEGLRAHLVDWFCPSCRPTVTCGMAAAIRWTSASGRSGPWTDPRRVRDAGARP